jgi:hypothetical protein
MFDLWPLFLLRDKGKQKDMTGTHYLGTLKDKFLDNINIKRVPVLFYFQKMIKRNYCFLPLCYLAAISTGSKSQLFQRWWEWEYAVCILTNTRRIQL